jgi:hypothetical protein
MKGIAHIRESSKGMTKMKRANDDECLAAEHVRKQKSKVHLEMRKDKSKKHSAQQRVPHCYTSNREGTR